MTFAAVHVPVLRLHGSALVVMPPSLDDTTASRLLWEIGQLIQTTDTYALIVDLTATDLVDSYLARCVRNMAFMAQLMGVPTVLCGMAPAVAMTLVEMGMEIQGVATASDLDSAVAAVDAQRLTPITAGDLLRADDERARADAAILRDGALAAMLSEADSPGDREEHRKP